MIGPFCGERGVVKCLNDTYCWRSLLFNALSPERRRRCVRGRARRAAAAAVSCWTAARARWRCRYFGAGAAGGVGWPRCAGWQLRLPAAKNGAAAAHIARASAAAVTRLRPMTSASSPVGGRLGRRAGVRSRAWRRCLAI